MNTNNSMTDETFADYIHCATLENAIEWNDDPEKYTYCIIHLDISAWDDDADKRVNQLENHFESLLEDAAIELQEAH